MQEDSRSITKTDWLLVGVLFVLVLPLRLWLLHNTEVTARDSIGYIRYALQFEHRPFQDVLIKNHQHPGYPLLVWLMSQPVRWFEGQTTPENMVLSAQLVNFFASLLLILPVYFLGRQFFDRRVSFGATLLYQYLPISAQLMSDGLSEPVFLVLLVGGLLQAVHAVRDRLVWRCLLCGLCTGLAYLIRPEGALLLPAFVCVLVLMQFRVDSRCSWSRFLACGAAMALTTLVIGSIYVAATGRITNKLSALEVLRNLWNQFLVLRQSVFASQGHGYLFAKTFAPVDDRGLCLLHSLGALLSEINQGFHYVASIPAILGLCWSFNSLRRDAGFWVVTVFSVLHSFILISLAMSVHYVSDRHVMILVLICCYFAAGGLEGMSRRFLAWCGRPAAAPMGYAILLAALIVFCLPKSTQRLHANRAPNRIAGLWLSGHVQEGDVILDDHAWSQFFSGLFFEEWIDPVLPADCQPTCFIVTTRSNDPEVEALRQTISELARVVYTWPPQCDPGEARIVVYAKPRDPVANPWRKKELGTR